MRIPTKLGTATAAAGLMTVTLVSGAGASAAEAPASSSSSDRNVAAASPTVSPKAPYFYTEGPNSYTCKKGNLCVRVYDPTHAGKKKYKVFKLYKCNTYSLSNWKGRGGYANVQTGNRATAKFYGKSGNVVKKVKVGDRSKSYNWTPVWKIRNCY